MKCPKCEREALCLGGCSAHPNNWYCEYCGWEAWNKKVNNKPYICFYREGRTGRDEYGYETYEYGEPELKRFESMEDLNKWIGERELDENTSPKDIWGESYIFDWLYRGKEEYGEEAY